MLPSFLQQTGPDTHSSVSDLCRVSPIDHSPRPITLSSLNSQQTESHPHKRRPVIAEVDEGTGDVLSSFLIHAQGFLSCRRHPSLTGMERAPQ